jgi:hypothetical protein
MKMSKLSYKGKMRRPKSARKRMTVENEYERMVFVTNTINHYILYNKGYVLLLLWTSWEILEMMPRDFELSNPSYNFSKLKFPPINKFKML